MLLVAHVGWGWSRDGWSQGRLGWCSVVGGRHTCSEDRPARTHQGKLVGIFHDVMALKRYPYYWPFVMGIYRSPMDSPHKGTVILSFNVFFIVYLYKLLNKHSSFRGFETPRRAWYDVTVMNMTPPLRRSTGCTWSFWYWRFLSSILSETSL